MHIVKYKNYEEYVEMQIKMSIDGYTKNCVWVTDSVLDKIVEVLKVHKSDFSNSKGLCHGVRTGYENNFLQKKLNFPVIGTDICDLAEKNKVPGVITYDFNKHNRDWINCFDFIYSNSLDHSIDPDSTLKIWSEQLKDDGILFLEWSQGATIESYADCFCATKTEYEFLVKKYFNILKIENFEGADFVGQRFGTCLFILSKLL